MDSSSSHDIISSEIIIDIQPDQPADKNITFMDVALHNAAEGGKIEAFNNVDLLRLESLRTPNGNTVLHVYLAKVYNRVDVETAWAYFALKVRSIKREFETRFVEEILNKCPSLLLKPNAKGQTPLHIAAMYGRSNIVKFLIKYRADASHGDLENQENEFEAVREMLRKTDVESNTALHVAVQKGFHPVVEILLEHEDPDFSYSANRNQETPIYIAARRGHMSSLDLILNKFKSPVHDELHDGPHGRTVLHAAAISGDSGVTRKILEKLGNLTKERDENGQTPLHYAAHLSYDSVVKELLKGDKSAAYVADKKLEMTPLLMAARQGHFRIITEIISCCPDCCEMVDSKGWNLLHFLAFRSYLQVGLYSTTSVRNLRGQKDAGGITPQEVAMALRAGLIPENESPKFTKKMEQIAELLQDIEKEEVAEVPVHRIQRDVFYISAKDMDKSNDAHLVVATLIATVTFAAALTVPGGYKSEDSGPDLQGTPFLIREAAFKAFVISNAFAFTLSLAAVYIHYQMAIPFLRIPRRASFAYAGKCIGYALPAVVIAFCTGTYAVLQPSHWLASVACSIGALGVGLSVTTQRIVREF